MLGDADHAIVERDPELPGLAVLLDAERLDAALRSSTNREPGQAAAVTYLRYKPGVNCIARFRFGDREGYAKAFGRGEKSKLAKALQASESDAATEPAFRLPDDHVVCRFFPRDARLPALAGLGSEETRQAMFERVFKEDSSWRDACFHTLNYKPERRFVARLDHPDGRRATLKLFNERDFAATRRSRKKLNLPDGLRLPDWIGGSKALRALVFEWLPGETLDAQLRRGNLDGVTQAGSAIARLHASEQPALGKRRQTPRQEVIATLSRQLSHLAPDLGEAIDRATSGLMAWAGSLEPPRRPVHGDFYAQQVILGNGTVGIIDMDSAHLGDPGDDLGCFIAQLERQSIRGTIDEADRDRARSALLAGHGQGPAGPGSDGLDPFVAFQLFKLTPRPFRDREPRWHAQTDRLLRRCVALLATGGLEETGP